MLLTSLLYKFGIKHVVVCPGSRNAPLVDAIARCEDTYWVHPVTDERSAGFVAIGLAETCSEPVAVCVTSGTAVANVFPAVVEAYHRNIPLVVVSADRPMEWIDQMDGQTMSQPGAYGRYAEYCNILPASDDEERLWYNNREMNRVLGYVELSKRPGHINIQLKEPLFDFESTELLINDDERRICQNPVQLSSISEEVQNEWKCAKRRMVIVGQLRDLSPELTQQLLVRQKCGEIVLLAESLSNLPKYCITGRNYDIDPIVGVEAPDLVLYLGGHIVSKKLKLWLRKQNIEHVWRIDHWTHTELSDTFMQLTRRFFVNDEAEFFNKLNPATSRSKSEQNFCKTWKNRLYQYDQKPQQTVVDMLMKKVGIFDTVVLANSSSVRYAQRSKYHDAANAAYVTCNRGVNGIEGTVSQAVGCALSDDYQRTICITGDLSFFYDHNALWNTEVPSNLRILLINDGGGEIFKGLKGLEKSPVRDTLVMAGHQTCAKGWCEDSGVDYMKVAVEDASKGVKWLMDEDRNVASVLEVSIWV